MNSFSVNENCSENLNLSETKMTKSATGANISPMNNPISVGTANNLALPNQQHQNTNFPRGTRNRQTFHGISAHGKAVSYFKIFFYFYFRER